MHYAFESWMGSAESPASVPESPESNIPLQHLNSLSEDLRSLEESLTFNLDEVFADYRSGLDMPPANAEEAFTGSLPHENQWDELARLVADHVLAYLQDMSHPLQTEMEKVRRTADEYYRDNRAMAVQIRHLLDEREQMLKALGTYELELSRYRNLMGNLYLRH